MEGEADLRKAVEDAVTDGIGRFPLPKHTTGEQLVAGLPPEWSARQYRELGVVHDLRPVVERHARPATLSAEYGLDPFPPHVDGAHLPTPPRLILLWCVADEERRPTLLYDWSNVESKLDRPQAEREVFVYRSGQSSRVSTIIDRDRTFVRYDPGCMRPATRNAASVLAHIGGVLADLEPLVIEWEPGAGIVFDNWSTLHARGAPQSIGRRHLLRMWLDSTLEGNA